MSRDTEGRDWRRHVTRTRVIVAGVAGGLATTLGIVGGVFDLFPGLRPDEPCPRVHAIELTEARVDRAITRAQSLDLLGGSKEGLPPERLAQPGKLVSVQATAVGYEDAPLEARTWVVTAGGAPVAEPELQDLLVEEWTPDGCEDEKAFRAWSPDPRRAGEYVIKVEVRPAESREVIEEARTEPFTVPPSAT